MKKDDNQFPIAYATHNADVFIADYYVPGTPPECEKSFSESLDALIRKMHEYIKIRKSFPRFLLLQDHVAVNISFDLMYHFEKELQAKLDAQGLVGVKAWCSFSGGDKKPDSILEKIRGHYPDYELENLKHNREVEYMCPDDERWAYLVYQLEVDEVAEKEYVLKKEKSLKDLRTAKQSPEWDHYYNLIQEAPEKKVEGSLYDIEFPEFKEGEAFEIILSLGKTTKAKIINGCTSSENGLEWQTTEELQRGNSKYPKGTRLGSYAYPRVIAWRRID